MNKTLGQIAYEAYAKYMFLVDHKGDILSSCIYDNVRDEVKEAWEEAAKAVLEAGCEHEIYPRETLVKAILEDMRYILSTRLKSDEVFNDIQGELEIEVKSDVNEYMAQFAERFTAIKGRE